MHDCRPAATNDFTIHCVHVNHRTTPHLIGSQEGCGAQDTPPWIFGVRRSSLAYSSR